MPISLGSSPLPLKLNAEALAITLSPSTLPNAVVSSSATPSLNGSLAGSPPTLLNGSTAIVGGPPSGALPGPGRGGRDTRVYSIPSTARPVRARLHRANLLRRFGDSLRSVRARTKPDVVGNRSAGDLANALRTAVSTASGSSGRMVRRGGTGSREWRASTSCAVRPRKG